MNMFSLLGAEGIFNYSGKYKFLDGILTFMNNAIIPLTVSLAVLAGVFSLVLVFLIIKAETADRAEEYKKRLKGLLLTVLIVIAFVWVFSWLLANLDAIIAAIRG